MKATGIIIVIAIQILFFVLAWNWLVEAAADAGRRQRGGVAFGITVHYGFYLISFAFVVGLKWSRETEPGAY